MPRLTASTGNCGPPVRALERDDRALGFFGAEFKPADSYARVVAVHDSAALTRRVRQGRGERTGKVLCRVSPMTRRAAEKPKG